MSIHVLYGFICFYMFVICFLYVFKCFIWFYMFLCVFICVYLLKTMVLKTRTFKSRFYTDPSGGRLRPPEPALQLGEGLPPLPEPLPVCLSVNKQVQKKRACLLVF